MNASFHRILCRSDDTAQGEPFLPHAERTDVMELLQTSAFPWPNNRMNNGRPVAVMMSGGVDSSVTAWLMKERGWNVVGITLRIPMADAVSIRRPCCGRDASLVARDLDIPHYLLDVEEEFEKEVIGRFRSSYLDGRTPNPCVDCNTIIKFGLVWDFLGSAFGIDYLATGHYARVLHSGGEAFLARGQEEGRDQSYFLYGIPRERLRFLELPLGEIEKPEVRRLAVKAGLHVAEKPDSMELCFAAEGNYRKILSFEPHPGHFVDPAFHVLGDHPGIENYTIGQRSGLSAKDGRPLFVRRIEKETGRIIVTPREELYEKVVSATGVNVLMPSLYRDGGRFFGKIRSGGELSKCFLRAAGAKEMEAVFSEPQFAPAPGQRLVLYDEDGRVAAGGDLSASENL